MAHPVAESEVGLWLAALAGRTATPGGGAAAGIAGAVGAALGTMAAHFTTGKKWADRELEARGLATRLDHATQRLSELADEDSRAFTTLQELQRSDAADPAALAAAEAAAAAVPLQILHECATAAEALASFAERCNPYLRADLRAAIHLLRGAGNAAWEIFLVNDPERELRQQGQVHRDALREAERASRRR